MDSTVGSLNYTGRAYKAAAWYGFSTGQYTCQIRIQNFTGRIFIEGSLATHPKSDEDWFAVNLNQHQQIYIPNPQIIPQPYAPYLEFPLNTLAPNSPDGIGDTRTVGSTFKSQMVWCRARIARDYIINPNINILGWVGEIKLSF